MKKSDSQSYFICRLLTQLLVLVAVGTSCKQVNGASLHLKGEINWNNLINNLQPETQGTTQVRKHWLLNQCSNRFVQVMGLGRKSVDARGPNARKMLSTIVFIPTSRGKIKMHAEETGNYICIARSGRPTSRANYKKKNCEFREIYLHDGSIQFVLADNSTFKSRSKPVNLYLGFNKKGRPLKGTDRHYQSKPNCFTFSKLTPNLEDKSKCPTSGSGPAGVSFCDLYKMFEKKPKQPKTTRKMRHNKNHKEHRRSTTR
ncbi:Fibroblast growth factor 18 [Mactra antiquata]